MKSIFKYLLPFLVASGLFLTSRPLFAQTNPFRFDKTSYNDLKMIATPTGNPKSTDVRFYPKTTGDICVKNNLGTEVCFAALAAGGTTNYLPKFTGATTLGDSLVSDDGTTLTYAGTGGARASSYTATGAGPSNITPAALPGAPVAGDYEILAGSPDLFWFFDDTAVRYVIATTNGKMRSFASFEGVCQDTTASFSFDTEATNDPAPACITGTNTKNRAVLDFDAAADEEVFGSVWLPADWTSTGGVDVDVEWQAAATTGNVEWDIQTICVADAEVYDPAWTVQGAADVVIDATKGTTNQRNIASFTGITVTGCAANERMFFHFWRDADDGTNDTMAGDARLTALRFKTRWTP